MATLFDSLTYKPEELRFGTSGLRGLVSDMTDLECYINTKGFLSFLQKTEGLEKEGTVYLAGDLRDSTPRIMQAVHRAITDSGLQTVYCGLIPTPAVAYYALQQQSPCIMVTGSHIPADRNGIKFYKSSGEVLKEDEAGILEAVAAAREQLYSDDGMHSPFDERGALRELPDLPGEQREAAETYKARYAAVFGEDTFAGKEIVFYQHSAVGRDMLVELLQALGAKVTPVGRSDTFVPIDSENVTPDDQAYFRQLAQEHPNAFAIVSTDGDSDRPFVVDEDGVFNRGDVLGAVVANWLEADVAAYPVSSSDAVDTFLQKKGVPFRHTKIGSPYVISAMETARKQGGKRVVGWEVNGGFMTGSEFNVHGARLEALPTRDAIFPIIAALTAATQEGVSVSKLFRKLPVRCTQAGLIDNFPVGVSKRIVGHFSADTPELKAELGTYFSKKHGFGEITEINTLDGVRIFFDNGDIAHLRPSGNAPQLRIYSVADNQERADEIVSLAIAEPDGIFRRLQSFVEEISA